MKDQIVIAIMIIGFLAFLYFGYRDDFRRNKGEFITIILGVPIHIMAYGIGGWIALGITILGAYITKEKVTKKLNELFDSKS